MITNMTIRNIISELDSMVLTSTNECKDYIGFIVEHIMSGLSWLHHPISSGTIISRCRKNAPNLNIDSFGCKKAKQVVDFQRASIPNESVFYGAVGDRDPEDGDFIAMLETSKLHRNSWIRGKEEIYVSRWRVTKDINSALICHPNVYVDSNPNGYVNEMQRNYKRQLSNYPSEPDFIPTFDRVVEFVAKQFAKKVPEGENSQYMISAFFAHFTLREDDGIVYPSVQVQGNLGYNVALRPDVVDTHLEFIGAEKHILYKANQYMQVPANKYPDEHLAASLEIKNLDSLPKID